MKKSCIITGIRSLRHFKTEFFHLRKDFKKKKSDVSDKAIPDWINVDKTFFDQIKNKVLRGKKNNLHAKPTGYGKIIFLYNASRLIENIENGEFIHEEALKIKDTIDKHIKIIVGQKRLHKNQIKVANILSLVDKTFTGKTSLVEEDYESDPEVFEEKSDEQPDTTDMPDLESEESTAQRRNQQGKGLTILTPNQMLSRLSISLAQLKVGNNSKNLKMKLGNYRTPCTDPKNLQNNTIKV